MQLHGCQYHAVMIQKGKDLTFLSCQGQCWLFATHMPAGSGILPNPLIPTASQLIHSCGVSLLKACHTDKQRIQNIAAAQSQHCHDSSTAAAQSQHGHDRSTTPNGSRLCPHLYCILKKILFITTLKTVYKLSSSDDSQYCVSVFSH